MPLAKSFAEELVAEYLILKNYLVITDVGIGSGKRGGRKDIDLVAVDLKNREIRLIDIKAPWIGKPDDISKEAYERLEKAEKVLRRIYGNEYKYVKELILLGSGTPNVKKIAQTLKNVKVKSLLDLIHEASDYIDVWKKEQKARGLVKPSTNPTLPDQLYLMKLLEFLKNEKII